MYYQKTVFADYNYPKSTDRTAVQNYFACKSDNRRRIQKEKYFNNSMETIVRIQQEIAMGHNIKTAGKTVS